ncbi:hypothetical protein A33O_06065 [Nitratireductor aquibiodomus RA22]|uniref:DUF2065 domain-containing protein n=2 Tax=Nitratireductor aquibiodomus TaxID=204799 RepID=A0A1H4J0G0_9HYPH|nr:DUF2065 family protein [Nitratireductor aquibiodomus]EIM76216.1 hypothetical protein A33O_06065 [Nitratireductor aquibiodomus RA22]SEB39800.1 hypothetical protein SAMN05216452_0856 [Nitratireductor aquibiodomus]
MSDFIAALGLVLVIEGLVYGGMPRLARRLAEQVLDMPDSALRTAGITAMVLGVVVVWLVRG